MKPSQTPVSDELLNAMLDGELDRAEHEALHVRISQDPVLTRRVRELMKLKQLVRLARPEDPMMEDAPTVARRRFSRSARAAVVLVALAGAIAIALQGRLTETIPPATTFAALHAEFDRASANDVRKVIIHAQRGDEASLQVLLDELDRLLVHVQRAGGGQLQVEVVADGPGLALLRADISPMIERIRGMKARYKNLAFVACNRTRSRLEREGGHSVPLMHEAEIVPSVQEQIAQRIQQGWRYIAA